MRLYIISPCRHEDIWRKRRATFVLPQMSLVILAALTPPHVEIRITDELVDDIDFSWPADLVAISSNTTNAFRAYEVARAFMERGAKVIMGGIHPSVMPEEAGLYADSVFLGEAEGRWDQVIDDFRSGKLQPLYGAGTYPDPDAIPQGRWDLLHGRRYYVGRTFQASRGCPHGCSFCSSTQFFGVKYRFRQVGQVVRELSDYRGRIAVFVDDNIAGSPSYARELFTALRPLKQKWVAQASIDIVKDNTLLRLAAESGCAGLLFGFESIHMGNSAEVRKLRKAGEYAACIREVKSHGIAVHGSFIFGFDHDPPGIFGDTVDFVLRNRLEVANYCKLTPFPGTRLYRDLSEQGRILHREWDKYDRYNIVFQPKGISIGELHEKTLQAYLRTFSAGSIIKRMPKNPGSVLPYLAMNISYRLGSRRLRRS